MIEIQHSDEHGLLELRMKAPVTGRDYTETLIPALDRAISQGARLRMLAVIEAEFSDFTLGAMLEDTRTGLRHWRGFDRIAIVTDNTLMKTAIAAFSVIMPCPVACFAMTELEDARRWLRESLGSIQQQEIADGVLHLRLRGKLDEAAYENDLEDLNRYMAAHDPVRLLIDLRDSTAGRGLRRCAIISNWSVATPRRSRAPRWSAMPSGRTWR